MASCLIHRYSGLAVLVRSYGRCLLRESVVSGIRGQLPQVNALPEIFEFKESP